MAKALSNIEPQIVWDYFEQICQYPHPSKQEEKLAAYIEKWAADHKFEVQKDTLGNIVVRKAATKGMENRTPIIIQGHIDMVCEKNSDVEFDFDNDPIQCYVDGDWVKAKGTTLGADNGIAIAMGMAVMGSDDIPHPDMELLCTLDEETGLTGAIQLETNLLKGDIMINLDSEEDGAFTIGCAGGINTDGVYAYEEDAVPADSTPYEITIKGLKGGHSGIEIHDGRGNAIKFMNRLLHNLTNKLNIRLSSFNSGNKHNAIPREGFATVVVPNAAISEFEKYVEDYNKTVYAEFKTKEPNINVSAAKCDAPKRVMKEEFQKRLLKSFYVMPHGVFRNSPDIDGLVQTSTNFAIVETREDHIFILTSQRSSVETEKMDMADMVVASIEIGGGVAKYSDGYPAWEPNMDSPILQKAIKVYEGMFGKKPVIEAIHAGLECGLIGEKYPGMDMLSFGPNLQDVHSPDEKIQISTTQNCWRLLLGIIDAIPVKG